uniref:RxLR effector candidate protein n=1 Tax=Hyaloperonospora arabidopsidis (strain Emoy2) TaxID=559515 RepID=M4BW93_HYAAE
MISTLARRYGDDFVVAMLAEAKNSGDVATKEIAMMWSEKQIQGWLTGHKSPDDVMTLLKLSEDHMSAKLEALERFITIHNQKNSGHVVLLDFLTSKYDEGELVSMLSKSVKRDDSANSKALELETLMLAKWVDLGLYPMGVMGRLGMSKTIEDLTNPKPRTFQKFFVMFHHNKFEGTLELGDIVTSFFSTSMVSAHW